MSGIGISSFNPALEPTRRWLDDPEIEIELVFLVRRLGPPARALIRLLAARSDVVWTESRLVEADPLLTRAVLRQAVDRVSQLSEALGFVPFVAISNDSYTIPPGTPAMALRALTQPPKKS